MRLLPIQLFWLAFMIFASCAPRPVTQSKNNKSSPKHIWSAGWSKDGKNIATGGDDSTLWLYNGNDYTLKASYKLNTMIKAMSWHPFDNLLAIATSRGVQLFNATARTFTIIPDLKTGGRGIGWNYNGELLGLADGGGVVRIFSKQGILLKSLIKHDNKSYLGLDWHPSKNILVTVSDEVILFDTSRVLKMFNHRKERAGILTADWHPSGEFFATGDYGHDNEGIPTLLQFWKEDGTLIREMKGSKAEYRNIRWNRDGSLLATASDAMRIWNKQGDLLTTGMSDENLWGISWSPDQKRIVTGSFGNGQVIIWDAKGKVIKRVN